MVGNRYMPGTWHFRTTFLAPGTQDYVDRLKQFHQSFMDKYRDDEQEGCEGI
jgi:hypothetical protein